MKRQLMMVLLGAAFLAPIDAEAQRAQSRGQRASRPAPIAASGRLARCLAPAGAQRFDCRSRVVYSSGSRRSGSYRASRLRVRANWGRVRMLPLGHRTRDRVLNKSRLRDVLGRRTVDRVRNAGRRSGLRGSLRGYWQNDRRGGTTLVVTMGRVEFAEFVDFNRDGRVDEIFLIRNDRGRRTARRY